MRIKIQSPILRVSHLINSPLKNVLTRISLITKKKRKRIKKIEKERKILIKERV